jgi:acetylornithine/succinyldiaminopimelate/putrescine aminotransferase/acyl-coenzyme A synthetase/AMP-(fatty) acid ligase/predicted amino acid dehydrogenase
MTEFDWIRHSAYPTPQWDTFRFQSLRDMIRIADDSELARPVLIGVVNGQATVVTLADLQTAVHRAAEWCVEQKIKPEERVAVVRLPYASELLVAVNAIALMANGVSVVLPMQSSGDSLRQLIQRTGCRFILTPVGSEQSEYHPSTTQALADTNVARAECGVRDCPLPVPWPMKHPLRPVDQLKSVAHCVDAEILILTTSSTMGAPKLVRYSERALLMVAESWQTAGLLLEQTTGGTSLCPLFSHSMGVRNVLHAIWTRHATLLIPPEWLDESPHRVVGLLQTWPPRHFTGGPALIQALARLGNSVPEARHALRSLAVVVSSGSAWDESTAGVLSNVQIANAFGMTETQQVLSTLIPPDPREQTEIGMNVNRRALGRPLPGVSVAVRFTDRASNIGRLFVKCDFKAIGYVGEPDYPEWLETGDCVRLCHGELEYAGRDQDDFINLGSGLKLSRATVEERYRFLARECRGLTFRQSSGRTGIIAIAFCGEQNPQDPTLHEHLRTIVTSFHERLQKSSDDFELRQTLLVAIGLISGEPPRTGPGKFNFHRIAQEHADLLQALNSPTGRHPAIIEIDALSLGEETWYQHLLPHAGQLMQALNLDVEFIDGEGDYLFRWIDGERRPVLDLVGGFGANLLGHGRSDLESAAIEAIQKVPLLDQFSRRSAAATLAKTLSDRFGDVTGRRYICLFHSTGAEAVETALKHALMKWEANFHEWNDQIRQKHGSDFPEIALACHEHNRQQFVAFRPLLIAMQGGYHGKTLGALNVMSDDTQRMPFKRLLGARVQFVRRDELTSPYSFLEKVQTDEALLLRRPILRNHQLEVIDHTFPGIFAAIAEPIQGEGGVFEVPHQCLAAIRDAQIPLILDEIQCGLGRSGQFPASAGIVANYYLVGKALGGGIGKISATLIDRADYVDQFDLQTGATFSGDMLSCQVAQKVLEILDRDSVPERASRLGDTLRLKLESVRRAFPEVILNITGRGAMLGIELGTPTRIQRFLKEMLYDQPGYFAASYLLHHHAVRILPTMSAPAVLRVEPSAYLSIESMDLLIHGLRDYCQRVESSDVLKLIQHLIPLPSVPSVPKPGESPDAGTSRSRTTHRLNFRFSNEPPALGARRVGFIFNPLYPTDELLVEMPELMNLAIDQRLELAERLQVLLQLRPIELFSRNLFGNRVWLCGIMLPTSAATLDTWKQAGNLQHVRQRLDEALTLASQRGCQTVVFGAQTSVVTANATSLLPKPGIQVSSGNSFTVAVMLSQIEAARRKIKIPKDSRLAVLGANGNIGSAITRWFAQPGNWDGQILMMGRSGSLPRLAVLRDELVSMTGNLQLCISDQREDLLSCDLIIVAVSGESSVLESHHVSENSTVLIADVSQPRGVSASVSQERPRATIVSAGLVRLPEDGGFRLTPHTPRGTCFACAAEAILMGLEPHPELRLRGEIDLQAVEILLQLGRKYGLIDSAT